MSGKADVRSPLANFFILSATEFNPFEICLAIPFPVLIEINITEAIIITIMTIITIVSILRVVSTLLPASTFISIRLVRSP